MIAPARATKSILPIALGAVVACWSEPAPEPEATAVAPVTVEELNRARAITSQITTRCSTCHTAGKSEIRRWGTALRAIERDCLSAALPLTPAERVACLRRDPSSPTSSFSPAKLGFFAAATTHASFRDLFAEA